MEMPVPNENHHRLKALVGNWTGKEKVYPSPWDPNGGEAVGHVENRMSLGDFAVVQDYTQEREGIPNFLGHGVFTFHMVENCFVLYWFDSMGMPPSVFQGNFQGSLLILTAKEPHGQSRATFDFPKQDSYTFKMEVSQDGLTWLPFLEGIYQRRK